MIRDAGDCFFPADPEENVKELLQPWQLLLFVLAGWVNGQQQDVIEYLLAENRVMRQKPGKRRILLNDEQRRMLGIKGKVLGRKVLEQVAGIMTPETILRWNRELIARHWDYSDRRKKTGRPAVPKEVADLVVKLAKENSRWGYNRIRGAVRNPGYSISDTAIAKISIRRTRTIRRRSHRMESTCFLPANEEADSTSTG